MKLTGEFVNDVLSEGTMRAEDLIPIFLCFLEAVDPNNPRVQNFRVRYNSFEIVRDAFGVHFTQLSQDEADFLLEDLFDALDAIAPEGCYFGAHEGDGSAYGFWKILDSESGED